MPGSIDELAQQLSQLSNDYYGDKRKARESDFMDKYGSKFKNDKGLGLAILDELDARGIDTSAADEAVQTIIDQLNSEVKELYNLLNDAKDAVKEQEEKIDTIKDVIDEQIADNKDSTKDSQDLEEPPAEPIEGGEEMPDAGAMPPEPGPDAGMAPPDAGAGAMPPEPPAPPAQDEQIQAGQMLSDARLKTIKRMKTAWTNRAAAQQKAANSFKPSMGIIGACGGSTC